ncbi:hypothetical protein AB0910_06145 [Streptomyces sp. NPDC047002]|uniref:hypothetical protein n=1 Tax=Streptomyces sp. NPDC047002 TaxID=3155475 RepID=UPI00345185AF
MFLTELVLVLVLRGRQGRTLAASLPAPAGRRGGGRAAARPWPPPAYQAAVSGPGIGPARARTARDQDALAGQARHTAAPRGPWSAGRRTADG